MSLSWHSFNHSTHAPERALQPHEETQSRKVEGSSSGEEIGAHSSFPTVVENYPPLGLKLSNSLKDNKKKIT